MIMCMLPNLALSVMYLFPLNDTKCTLFFIFKNDMLANIYRTMCIFFCFHLFCFSAMKYYFATPKSYCNHLSKNTMFEFIATVQKEKHFNSKHFLNKVGHFKNCPFFHILLSNVVVLKSSIYILWKKWSFLDYNISYLSRVSLLRLKAQKYNIYLVLKIIHSLM